MLEPGFKMTEIGPLPEEWEVGRLGKVCHLVKDKVDPRQVADAPYAGLEHIDSHDPRLRRWGSSREVRSSKGLFSRGDVLYGKLRPYLAKAALAEFEGVCSTDILILRARQEFILPEMLVSVLYTRWFLQHAINTTVGTNLPRTRWSSLREFSFPLPPLPEQRAIARVLSAVRRAIEATEAVIEAAQALKKSLMGHLFTYGPVPVDEADQVPLKETEIGLVPEGWEVVKLGDVTNRPQYGYTASATDKEVGPKFLRITDIQNDSVHWPSVPYCKADHAAIEKYRLANGDLVFARIGATTGKTYLVRQAPAAVFASYLIRSRANHDILRPEYLRYFTETQIYWKQIDAAKGGRLKKGINIPILTSLLLPLPALAIQDRVSHILNRTDAKIETERTRKSALEALFNSLLHHLMTGQVRVPREYWIEDT